MNKIDASEADYLYVEPSQLTGAGKGLYTAIDIHKGEIIALYKGKIITNEQANTRITARLDQYFINMPDGSIMDSGRTKCFAKFANDAEAYSDSKLRNNAKITLNDSDKVCLAATRNIKPGEEIFCGYGKRYWKKHR